MFEFKRKISLNAKKKDSKKMSIVNNESLTICKLLLYNYIDSRNIY